MSDITLAASANAFEKIFEDVVEHFTYSNSDSANFGPFSASYALALHLEGGSVTLNDNDTIDVAGLKVVFDTLTAEVCFTLPSLPVGGFCIMPDPWNGCLARFPEIDIGGLSVCPRIDLSGLVSDITDFDAGLRVSYYVDPERLPGWTDLEAELNGHPNKWQIFVAPTLVDIDPIDVPATIANVVEEAVKAVIEDAVPKEWRWALDLLWEFIGPVIEAVVEILGIVGDIEEWFETLLNDTFNLLSVIETALADYFANKYPLEELDDPYPVLSQTGTLIPVTIPIRDLTAIVDSEEMIVQANVGAV